MGDFGPLTYQNDNVLQLLHQNPSQLLNTRDQSELYGYEIVNLVNGTRSVGEICDAVSAEYGPLPLKPVLSVGSKHSGQKMMRPVN